METIESVISHRPHDPFCNVYTKEQICNCTKAKAAAELAALEAVRDAARKFRVRSDHAYLCPKRADYKKECDCHYDEFVAALKGAE